MSRLLTAEEVEHYRGFVAAYRPSSRVVAEFQSSNFAVISGPAGAGKDTLRNSLLQRHPLTYQPVLSTTTRPPRTSERDGQDYYFSTLAEFNEKLTKRGFLQVALVHNQQLSGLHSLEIKKLKPDQHGLSILIVQTEAELRDYHPSLKTIFVIPPDKETLLERIDSERMLDSSEIERRLQAAKGEISRALESAHYYCLVSDTVDHICSAAHAYLQEHIWHKEEDVRARNAMHRILNALDN